MNKNFAPFAQWIWSNRANELALYPSVLTDWNNDPTLPQPPLSNGQAHALFMELENLKLVFPTNGPEGTAYWINQLKEREWLDAINQLRKPVWLRSPFIKQVGKVIGWCILLILSVFLGDVLHDAYKTKIRPGIFKTDDVEGRSNQNGQNRTQRESSQTGDTQK
jgi:hypothetical protein